MHKIILKFKNNLYEILSFVLFIIYFAPILFFPNRAKYLIHDNLDSNVVWYKRLAESGKMFANGNEILDYTMGGLPRKCMVSEWSIDRLMYLFLTPQTAYAVNYILIHIIAFMGMRLLIKRYISEIPVIYNLVSLTFAFLPFWPSGGLSVAGMPLLVFAMLNIFTNKSNKSNWLILFFFPFYSFLPFGNAFSFPLLFLGYLTGALLRKWVFKWMHILAFIIIGFSTLIVEYRLILLLLSGFKSNRIVDFVDPNTFMNIKGVLGSSIYAFFYGHYHFHSLNSFITLVCIVYILFYFLNNRKIDQNLKYSIFFIIIIAFLCLITLFIDNYNLKEVLGKSFPRISLRFWVVFPLMWYVVFALVLSSLYKIKSRISILLLLIQLIIVFLLINARDYFGSRYAENIFANTLIHPHNHEQQLWDNYYMTTQFNFLKKENPYLFDKTIATIGMNPEVAQYNGFRTIEGYYSLYPIEKFILLKEIDRKERVYANINHFSHTNRNYLFINENNFLEPKWNYDLLSKNNVIYILSSKKIEKLNNLNLKFSGGIYLYKIKD
jgi:hypothetical protein